MKMQPVATAISIIIIIIIIIIRMSHKSFIGETYLKSGTISWLAFVFFGQEPIEFFVKHVVLFTSGLK
jgi:hypothetical protein